MEPIAVAVPESITETVSASPGEAREIKVQRIAAVLREGESRYFDAGDLLIQLFRETRWSVREAAPKIGRWSPGHLTKLKMTALEFSKEDRSKAQAIGATWKHCYEVAAQRRGLAEAQKKNLIEDLQAHMDRAKPEKIVDPVMVAFEDRIKKIRDKADETPLPHVRHLGGEVTLVRNRIGKALSKKVDLGTLKHSPLMYGFTVYKLARKIAPLVQKALEAARTYGLNDPTPATVDLISVTQLILDGKTAKFEDNFWDELSGIKAWKKEARMEREKGKSVEQKT